MGAILTGPRNLFSGARMCGAGGPPGRGVVGGGCQTGRQVEFLAIFR
ncbi:hypothetical protein APS67_003196 [Streptomyces sp. AVP053U2]|nr:hypothetical protein APS67_003196 [Streptomyces sp. AVP053U2]